MNASEIREKLKAYMARTGKTSTNIASFCEVHTATIDRFLDGKGEPHRLLLKTIAELVESDGTQNNPDPPRAA